MVDIALIQSIVNGVLSGSVYSLLGVGLSLMFGVMRIINLAHGDIMILGAYASFWLVTLYGIDPYLSLFFTIPMFFGIGFAIYKGSVGPSIARVEYQMTGSLLITYALALFIMNMELIVWSSHYRLIETDISRLSINVSGISLNVPRTFILGFAVAVTLILYYMLSRTKFGRAIRSTSQDREASMIMGVKFHRLAALITGLGSSIAALVGMLYIVTYQIHPSFGIMLTLKAIIVLILGGMGSVAGPFIAGLLLGVVENVGSFYVGAIWRDTIAFIFLIVVLLVRPKGLFGREVF